MCQIIPFPSAEIRRAIRSNRLRQVLEIAKREGFVYLNNQEHELIRCLRKLPHNERQFFFRGIGAMHATMLDPSAANPSQHS